MKLFSYIIIIVAFSFSFGLNPQTPHVRKDATSIPALVEGSYRDLDDYVPINDTTLIKAAEKKTKQNIRFIHDRQDKLEKLIKKYERQQKHKRR